MSSAYLKELYVRIQMSESAGSNLTLPLPLYSLCIIVLSPVKASDCRYNLRWASGHVDDVIRFCEG